MATYLQLCQDVARDSGTVPGSGSPATVTGQEGRLLSIVNWTAEAYSRIQTKRRDWRWLKSEFSGSTVSGAQTYSAASMGLTSRFSHWITPVDGGLESPFTCYKTATGVSDETVLVHVGYEDFYRRFQVGTAATDTGKPTYFCVDNNNDLRFWPIPDAAYTIRGHYYKGPQVLAADDDVPEMPEPYHDLIKWRALQLLGQFDEAFEQMPYWQFQADVLESALIAAQIPRMRLAGPIA